MLRRDFSEPDGVGPPQGSGSIDANHGFFEAKVSFYAATLGILFRQVFWWKPIIYNYINHIQCMDIFFQKRYSMNAIDSLGWFTCKIQVIIY